MNHNKHLHKISILLLRRQPRSVLASPARIPKKFPVRITRSAVETNPPFAPRSAVERSRLPPFAPCSAVERSRLPPFAPRSAVENSRLPPFAPRSAVESFKRSRLPPFESHVRQSKQTPRSQRVRPSKSPPRSPSGGSVATICRHQTPQTPPTLPTTLFLGPPAPPAPSLTVSQSLYREHLSCPARNPR